MQYSPPLVTCEDCPPVARQLAEIPYAEATHVVEVGAASAAAIATGAPSSGPAVEPASLSAAAQLLTYLAPCWYAASPHLSPIHPCHHPLRTP